MADGAFFPYRIDQRWGPMFLLLGVGSDDGVHIDGGNLRATFGRVSVNTPLLNIDHTDISGPHRWYTAVGLRLSAADDGITFGTNHHRGLCIAFKEPVKRIIGFKNHSALWVSVADPDGLAEAIAAATAKG